MSDKKPLPTWKDRGFVSALNWKPSAREATVSKAEAEKKLNRKGEYIYKKGWRLREILTAT